ncbi:MAG: AAA family ATPase [Candidatus Bathyarchaeia archaeon]
MKIRKLHIEKYKSLSNIDLQLNKDLNLFVGKNNSGKSNIIDALVFLSRLAQGRDVVSIFSEYGGYKEIIFGKKLKEKIAFNLEFDFSKEDLSFLFHELNLAPEISLDKFREALSKSSYSLQLEENRIALEEVHICYDKNDIIYAKGSYRDEMYHCKIIENFRECVIKGNWKLTELGGRSPAISILSVPTMHSPIRVEESLLLFLQKFISSFIPLAPVRHSPEAQRALGTFRLNPSGDNLPQVLNTIASSNRRLFEKIMSSAGKIIEEIEEIRSPLKEGTQDTYVSIVEKAFKDTEFSWRNVASGTKEILFLATLLHTTPKGSLLMIEEPELHLHADAIKKLLSLATKVCQEDDKQIIITTHSPTLIDFLSFEKIFTVVKEDGETKIEPLKEGKDFEDTLLQAGIPKSFLLMHKLPLFLLIVESREDVKIWNKFLNREGIDLMKVRVVSSGEPGGGNKDMEMGKFLKRARIPIPFMVIRDSDNKKQEKEKELEKAGFKQNEYYVLSKKEIEDYLLDPEAISGIVGRTVEEVKKQMEKAKGEGKEKLENLFKLLELSKPDEGVKELLASRVKIPQETLSIIDKIRKSL